jgi:hypothetical protein
LARSGCNITALLDWWDRRDFIRHAEPGQVAKILTEGEQLTREVHRRGDLAVTWRDVV